MVVVVVVLELSEDVERPAASASGRPVRGGRAGGLRRGRGRVRLGRSLLASRGELYRHGARRHQDHGGHSPTRRPRAGCVGTGGLPGELTGGQGTRSGGIVLEWSHPLPGSEGRLLGPRGLVAPLAAIAPRARTPGVPGGSGSPLCPMRIVTDHSPTPREPMSRPDVFVPPGACGRALLGVGVSSVRPWRGVTPPRKIVVCEGDETGQELLEASSSACLDPSVLGFELELMRFDLSLAQPPAHLPTPSSR